MKDTELYQHLLGRAPWFVRRVELDAPQAGRVDVYVEHGEGARFACPKCGQDRGVDDHVPERLWRHLDTCQYAYVRSCAASAGVVSGGLNQSSVGALGGGEFSLHPALRWARARRSSGLRRPSGGGSLGADLGPGVGGDGTGGQSGACPHAPPSSPRIGVDEKSFPRRHRYETLVFDLDRGTVEHVAEGRSEESLAGDFRRVAPVELGRISTVVMDMGAPYYIQATRKAVPGADGKIVFARYHIMAHMAI